MSSLAAAGALPLPFVIGLILLVYLICLGGVGAATIAWRGHPSYWFVVLGAFLFLLGILWGRGLLSGATTLTAVGVGVVASIFGVALDLIVGPPFKAPQRDPIG